MANSKCKLFIRYTLPFLGYAGLIFWSSSQSSIPFETPMPISDKLIHFLIYLVFGYLCVRSFGVYFRTWAPATLGFVALFCSVLYGFFDEVHQLYVPQRTFDVWDLFANTAGAALGILIRFMMIKLCPRFMSSR